MNMWTAQLQIPEISKNPFKMHNVPEMNEYDPARQSFMKSWVGYCLVIIIISAVCA